MLKQARLARRLRREVRPGVDRLAGGQDRRPQRAADGRLSQGHGRYPRPDRPHRDRGVVRQPHERPGWKACSTSRCRRTPRSPASACGSATSWSRPTSSRSSGPARSTRRSSARSAIRACWNGRAATSSRPACSPSRPTRRSGSRSPTRRCCRCGATAIATATPCRARCSSSTRCASWRST